MCKYRQKTTYNIEYKRTTPKYLNSFIIPDDIIKKMDETLKESRTKEIELGFSLCKRTDNNILKIGEQCVGGECSISLPEQCEEKDDIYVGTYHTHFNESSRPSSQDIPIIYKRGLACIGGIHENKIRNEEINCYTRNVPKDIESIYRFKDKLVFIKDRIERRKEIDKFVKDNFDIIKIK